MQTMMPTNVRWSQMDHVITLIENWSMVILFMIAGCLGLLQIILRYLFSMGFDWVEAYLIMLIVYAALIGASVAVRRGVHVRLDVIVNKFPKKLHWIVVIASNLLCLFYTCAIWVFCLKYVMQVTRFQSYNILSDLPEWVHYAAGPVGLGLMSIRYIQEIWRIVAGGPGRLSENGEHNR